MKLLRPWTTAALVLVGVLALDCSAQTRQSGEYQPARPTISPYAGLLQTNVGSLPNYFSLVRPRLEQTAYIRQLQATTRVQSISIQNVRRETLTATTTQTGRSAGFEQYLHFYPPIRLSERIR